MAGEGLSLHIYYRRSSKLSAALNLTFKLELTVYLETIISVFYSTEPWQNHALGVAQESTGPYGQGQPPVSSWQRLEL